jgi:hypothetical protein
MVSFIMSSGWKSKILPVGLTAALKRYEKRVYHPLATSDRGCSV